jgi:hypothetical protein
MSTKRADWVTDSEVPRCLGNSLWNAGSFIRNEFAFSNWIKRGREYLYSKKDLLPLGQELKDRNIDLKRYQEFLVDNEAFDKRKSVPDKNQKSKGKPYSIPRGLNVVN